MRYFFLFLALAAGFGCGPKADDTDPFESRTVTLPNGREIRAEVRFTPVDVQRGMMFRDSLPEGQGMLFLHPKPGIYTYWMYQCRIPLDIVWMDSNQRIVEIAPNSPPCKTRTSECPVYGGHAQSQYVLELGAGEAARNRLQVGQSLTF